MNEYKKNAVSPISYKKIWKPKEEMYTITKKESFGETITEKLRSNFNDSDKYLKEIPGVIIGKILKGPREDVHDNVVRHTWVGSIDPSRDISDYDRSLKTKKTFRLSTKSLSRESSTPLKGPSKRVSKMGTFSRGMQDTNHLYQINSKSIKGNYVEFADDKKIKEIYDYYTKLIQVNKDLKKQDSILPHISKKVESRDRIPQEIKNEIDFQVKTLKMRELQNEYHQSLEKYLKSKTNKAEDDLLINSGESHRLRKELFELADAHIPVEEKYGIFHWIISLRKPKNFKGTRHAFINYGDDYNPFWQMFKETLPPPLVKIRNPYIQKNRDFRALADYLTKEGKMLNTIQELNQLEKNIVRFYL